MSTIIYSFFAYHSYLFIIYHPSYIIHFLDATPPWSLQLALFGQLGLLKALFFCFNSLFHSLLLAGRFFLLVLFDLSRRLFGQLCFLNSFFLSVFFGQLYSFDDSLLGSFSSQLCLLKALFCQCSLDFLQGSLVSFVFWIALFC